MKKGEHDKETPKCDLCGKTKKLTRTECCGNWICDDEEDYVPFSYARNSCHRNHNHYTLCAYHYNEGHSGDWKECPQCREDFPTELYVWHGTNEYNFEKLTNPPSYKPTRCAICGKVVKLGTDNYTQSGDDYWCEICADRELAGTAVDREREIPEEPSGTAVSKKKVGRNDPCPCGSGKKYKKCCYGKEESDSSPEPAPAVGVLEELKELLKEKEFGSLKEAQAFLDWHRGQRNRAPVDDFEGLSPEQMHRFLHFPFSSPDLVTFPARLPSSPEAPAMKLFGILADAVGEKGLRTTAKGNLPVKVVQEAALACRSDEKRRFHGAIRSETDFFDFHVVRLTSGLAGLTRKYLGRFLLTARCRKLLAEGGMEAIYPLLFRAFVEKYNWAYRDYFSAFAIIQQSFLFTLWLLHRFGKEWRPSEFYEDCFLKAFPMVLAESESENSWTTPEKLVRSRYSWRCLERFALFFGLVEIERGTKDVFDHSFRLKKTALLDQAVTFAIKTG